MKVNSQLRNLKKSLSVHIEPLQYKPDPELINKKWKMCLEQISEILKSGNVNFCYQELYQTINDLITFEIPAEVINTFEKLFMNQAESTVQIFKSLMQITNIDQFFLQFNSLWEKITYNFNLLKKILSKFEKKYFSIISNSISQTSVWSLYLENLKKIFSRDNSFIQHLTEKILYKISKYRIKEYKNYLANEKEDVEMTDSQSESDLEVIKLCINFLWETSIYKETFSENYLSSSSNYLSSIIQNILSSRSIEDYISFAELAFEVENKLIHSYLNEYSLKKMINMLESKFIYENRKSILSKIFPKDDSTVTTQNLFLDSKKLDLIKRVYILFKRIKIEEELRKSWLEYLDHFAEKIFKEFNKNYTVVKFFENIKNLKINIDQTLHESFLDDDKFKATAKEGFVKTLNLKPNAVADYFSNYVHHILIDSDTEENKIIETVSEFMNVFKYLDAKDMFESFHIKRLGNRLLYNLTNSTKGEKYLMEKLRSQCGNVFVTKSEEMLSDIENSMEMTLNCKLETPVNFNVNFYVLSTYAWPINKIVSGLVNDSIFNLQNDFKNFYKSKFAGKALNWHLPWCSGDLSYQINNKSVMLHVNGVQAAILLKYTKSRNSLSLKELIRLTTLEKDDVLYNVTILSNNHVIIYDKENDSFKLNPSFHPTKSHLNINDHNSKEETSVDEIREVEERNWEDRKHVIDALLMKTLKAKKQLKTHDLIEAVLKIIKFPCEISVVGTRIQLLISNGYLTKDEKDEDIVKYNP
jgi:hypothetical protein